MALYDGAQSTHNFANLINITDSTGNLSISSRTPRSIDERLGEFFKDGRASAFTDADLAQVSFLLQNSNRASYSRTPRLYTVLRIINHLELLDEFLASNITDVSFPFDATSFPFLISSKIQTEFLQHQSIVLTNTLHLEKGERGGHLYFEKGKSAPYEVKGKLGFGSYGAVQKVVSLLSHQEFARKLILRTKYGRKNYSGIKAFHAELQVLKRISHSHCVKLIGSYTDLKYVALIMSPVADCNLASYMEESVNSVDKQSLLRTFFGCLCNGLQYLHQSKIRHRDVKPENILVKGDNVLWTDFGISLDWEHMSRSTTTTDLGRSPVYCAPEVANFEARNSSSDIWSLGCVFLEMTTILKGQTVSQMRQNFKVYSDNYRFYTNIKPVSLWIENLYTLKSEQDNEPLKWIESMLNVNLRDRPTAQTLFSIITNHQVGPNTLFSPAMFCGLCCVEGDESCFGSESDGEQWIEEPEEHRTLYPYLPSVNLDPALAQPDQYSAALASDAHREQDPDQSSSDALSNNIFSRCHNNDGDVDVDDDGGRFSSLRNSVDHLQSANIDNSVDCMFLSNANNQGEGFPARGTMERHAQSRHRSQKFNCTFPGCDDNQGKGFATLQNLERHAQSRHRSQKSNCTFPGCDNNQGKGFSDPCSMERHARSRHQGQKFNCTFPGCDNNQGKGFSDSFSMERHARSRHQGQKSNCTFPGCDNNQGKGFATPKNMERHVGSKHRGLHRRKTSNCTFPGCGNNQGKGFASSRSMERHAGSRHQGQKSNCSFPGCDNNQGKGYHPETIKRHVRVVHFGQKSRFSRHSSSSGGGEGSTDHDSVASSENFGGGRDITGIYQGTEKPL